MVCLYFELPLEMFQEPAPVFSRSYKLIVEAALNSSLYKSLICIAEHHLYTDFFVASRNFLYNKIVRIAPLYLK